MKLNGSLLAGAALLACSASPAAAATYNINFVGAGEVLTGVATTTGTSNSQLLSSLTGTLNGAAITLVAPGVVTLAPSNDNLLFPNGTGTDVYGGSKGFVDYNGIGFTAAGSLYNLYYDSTASGNYTIQNNATLASKSGVFSVTQMMPGAVPEPATWGMIILGMGAIGFAMRRRKVTTRVSYAA